jgi:hypothetical protein
MPLWRCLKRASASPGGIACVVATTVEPAHRVNVLGARLRALDLEAVDLVSDLTQGVRETGHLRRRRFLVGVGVGRHLLDRVPQLAGDRPVFASGDRAERIKQLA